MATSPSDVVERLQRAVNAHDLDAVAGCFAAAYRNETPVHPGRGFVGREQVRKNWEQIFGGVPDIQADLLRTSVDHDVVWSEWAMHGTRRDGEPAAMRGVVIFGVADDQAEWARFYLEPADTGADGVDAAVGRLAAERTAGPV